MKDKNNKPLDYFKHAYGNLLPVFMGDVMDAGNDFDALASAAARLCDEVLGLSNIPHSTAIFFIDYADYKNRLDISYSSSSIVAEDDFQIILQSMVKYLNANPIQVTRSFLYEGMDNGEIDKSVIPNTVLVIPIRTATITCGYTVIYYHDNDNVCSENSPQVTFISKVMYLVALALQCEFNKAMLEHYMMSDYLTGLPNRDHVYEAIIYLLQSSEVFGHSFALLIIRINGLNNINNSLGIITGDLMLKSMGTLIESAVDESIDAETLVGRLNGGDFIVLITLPDDKNSPDEANAFIGACCNAIVAKAGHHVEINGYKLYPSTNIGASIYPDHGDTAEELLRKAELAKNDAKLAGPGTYRIYESFMDGDAEEILFLNSNLPAAISSNQFKMYYQAMVDLKSGEITSAEALIRWYHPERGLILPNNFMPFAEKNAYGTQIDLLVLHMACQQIRTWQDKGIDIAVSVNISPRHFINGLIYDSVKKALENSEIEPSRLRIEVLETILLDDFNVAVKAINDLRLLGVEVALDDFGSGYSSFEYVVRLPMDFMKIDKTFMVNLQTNSDTKVILEAIIALAKALRVKTVAEGVERQEDLDLLRTMGYDVAQGFIINKPVNADSFELFLKEWKPI